MEEWKEVRMSDIIEDISMGPFGSDIKRECYVDDGVPYLNGSNVQGIKLGEKSFIYVSEEKAKSLKKSIAHRGDLIVTHRGTLGQIVYVPDDSKYNEYLISNSQFRITLKKEIVSPVFLAYYFHSREGQNKILANSSQVGVPALGRPTSTFRQITIKIPSLQKQNKIVSILKSLDDKIENNRKINENLEQQAQALFKSWFVDFEPFRDQPFVESELGMIPEGWRVGTLGNICTTNKRNLKGQITCSIKYLDTGNITRNKIESIQCLDPTKDTIPSRARRCVIEGDIVYSTVRPNQEHYGFLVNPPTDLIVSTGFCVITANWSVYRYYIYQYLIQDSIITN